MIAYCGKEVQNLAVVRGGVAHSIGRQDWELQRARNPNRSLIAPLLLAFLMSLQFDVDIARAEDANQLFDRLTACLLAAAHQRSSKWAFIAARQADQTGAYCCRSSKCGCAFLLRGLAHLELRDELAEVLIALHAIRRADGRRAGSADDADAGAMTGGVSLGPKLDTAISAPTCARILLRFALV